VTYGGDSGNRIFVLCWRCPLIRGSTVYKINYWGVVLHAFAHVKVGFLKLKWSSQLYSIEYITQNTTE
jgi:hypothetical protein